MDSLESKVPPEFLCPITGFIMREPVITAVGSTYEKRAIQTWFQSGNITDPLTNAHLETTALIPNFGLRSLIQAYLEKNPQTIALVCSEDDLPSIHDLSITPKEENQPITTIRPSTPVSGGFGSVEYEPDSKPHSESSISMPSAPPIPSISSILDSSSAAPLPDHFSSFSSSSSIFSSSFSPHIASTPLPSASASSSASSSSLSSPFSVEYEPNSKPQVPITSSAPPMPLPASSAEGDEEPNEEKLLSEEELLMEANTELHDMHLDEAFAIFNQACIRFPHSYRSFTGRGRVLLSKGEPDAAISDLETASKLADRDPLFFVRRARERYDRAQFPDAVEDCSKALQMDARCIPALVTRYFASLAKGVDETRCQLDMNRAEVLDEEFAQKLASDFPKEPPNETDMLQVQSTFTSANILAKGGESTLRDAERFLTFNETKRAFEAVLKANESFAGALQVDDNNISFLLGLAKSASLIKSMKKAASPSSSSSDSGKSLHKNINRSLTPPKSARGGPSSSSSYSSALAIPQAQSEGSSHVQIDKNEVKREPSDCLVM